MSESSNQEQSNNHSLAGIMGGLAILVGIIVAVATQSIPAGGIVFMLLFATALLLRGVSYRALRCTPGTSAIIVPDQALYETAMQIRRN